MAFTRVHKAAAGVLAAALALSLSVGQGAAGPSAQVCATPRPSPTATVRPTPSPTVRPSPSPTVSTGIPPIPVGRGTLLRKDFSDGVLTPLRVLTFPDAHIGQPGQFMTVFNRFAAGAQQTSIHNGYIDIRSTPRGDGLWNSALLGTSQDGIGALYGYGRYEFMVRANVGFATWQSIWLYDTKTWTATEIDWPELLENKSLSAHVIGQGAGSWYGAAPADWATVWHKFWIERAPTYVAFGIDGSEIKRITATMPSTPLAILLDSKVGHPWAAGPSASTPNPTWIQVAWITVDPLP